MTDFVTIGTRADVPEGQVRVFSVEGYQIAVANVGGAFYAIENVCSHDGGPLGEGTLFGDLIECPRHGARFDVKTGRPRTLPAVMPVRTYEVLVEGDDVKVRVNGG